MAEKQEAKSGFVRGAGRLYVRSVAGSFDDTAARIDNIKRIMRGRNKSRRIETFSEAVARLGLDEADIQERANEINATAFVMSLIFLLTITLLFLSLYFSWSFGVISLLVLASGWSAMQWLSWRFRYCQIRDRELYKFTDWLLGRRPGDFK